MQKLAFYLLHAMKSSPTLYWLFILKEILKNDFVMLKGDSGNRFRKFRSSRSFKEALTRV
jgi:hypothetical protein